MLTLGMWIRKTGTRLEMTLTPTKDITTYVVIVNRYTGNSKVTDARWLPSQLEDGVGIDLANGIGYDFNLKATIKADTTMHAVIKLGNQTVYDQDFPLKLAEGVVNSREWSVILK